MNLFELFVKVGVDDQASGKLSKLSSSLGKGLATAAKVGTAAIGAASTAIVALGKIGLDYNKQMETYTTNFEVMMGDAEAAAKKVEELKEMGASTPFELGDLASATQTLLAFNVSADDSTKVLRKLGDISLGNKQKLETLTRAYGKMNASQKVTLEDINMMIDAGFNPLLIVAEETGKTMTEVYDDISKGKVSFEQIEDAISKATSASGQFYQGMQKASQTTEGLISTLKDNATALVGEVFMPISEGLQKTVLPSAINAINTLSEEFKEKGVDGMIAAAGEMLGNLVNSIVEYAPEIVEAAVTLVNSLIQGLSNNQESLAMGAVQIITTLANGLLNMLPQIIKLGLDFIVSLAKGIADSIPELIPTIIETVLAIVETLTDPDTLGQLVDAAIAIITALSESLLEPDTLNQLIEAAVGVIKNLCTFLVENLSPLLQAAIDIIVALVSYLISPEGLETLGSAAVEIIGALASALIGAVGTLLEAGGQLISELFTVFTENDWGEIGKNILEGIKSGIKNAWNNLKEWFSGLFDDLISIAKNILGIKSPSRVFKKIGAFTAEGFGAGFNDAFRDVEKDIENALDFNGTTFGVNAYGTYSGGGMLGGIGGTSFGTVNINIDGYNAQDDDELAETIAEKLQIMTERRGAAFA